MNAPKRTFMVLATLSVATLFSGTNVLGANCNENDRYFDYVKTADDGVRMQPPSGAGQYGINYKSTDMAGGIQINYIEIGTDYDALTRYELGTGGTFSYKNVALNKVDLGHVSHIYIEWRGVIGGNNQRIRQDIIVGYASEPPVYGVVEYGVSFNFTTNYYLRVYCMANINVDENDDTDDYAQLYKWGPSVSGYTTMNQEVMVGDDGSRYDDTVYEKIRVKDESNDKYIVLGGDYAMTYPWHYAITKTPNVDVRSPWLLLDQEDPGDNVMIYIIGTDYGTFGFFKWKGRVVNY